MARLFLDMDGTLAKFHDEANYLERMYEEDFFYNLAPFENMLAGAKLFMEQHPDVPVFVISSCVDSEFCTADKHRWLDDHLNIPRENRIFPPMGAPKADYIPGGVKKDDFLLDDYNRGLNQFMYDGGSAIKCHNNINQKGLGAHGGSSGNLWIGPMVHVDDKPEMIAAEIAQCMGLSYNLETVKQAYPETKGYVIHDDPNPLDSIRFYAGKKEFQNYGFLDHTGKTIYVPEHQLRDISLNTNQDPDFKKLLRDDIYGFYSDSVIHALQQAKKPLVGRLDYFDLNGLWAGAQIFRSQIEMERALETAPESGRYSDVKATWYVKTKPLSQILSRYTAKAAAQTAHSSLSDKIKGAEKRNNPGTPSDKEHQSSR